MTLPEIRKLLTDLLRRGGTLDEYARLKLAELDAKMSERKQPTVYGGGIHLL